MLEKQFAYQNKKNVHDTKQALQTIRNSSERSERRQIGWTNEKNINISIPSPKSSFIFNVAYY